MATKRKPAKKTLKIILDSNALFVPLQLKIDIFEELKALLDTNFEPILLSPIKHELEKLSAEASPQTRRDAAYALKLAEECKLVETNEKEHVPPDEVILKVAHDWNCPVFTNDRLLRKKLRDINVPVIYVRQKSRLEIDGRL
jgi:rRNA-processing protein FCF1